MEHHELVNITTLSYIKEALCKYIFKPLQCDKEDIIRLVQDIDILCKNKDYEYENWFKIIKKHTKLESVSEIDNILGFVKNRVCQKSISSYCYP